MLPIGASALRATASCPKQVRVGARCLRAVEGARRAASVASVLKRCGKRKAQIPLVRYMCAATDTDHAAKLPLTVPLQIPSEVLSPPRCRYRYRSVPLTDTVTAPLWVPWFVFIWHPRHEIFGRHLVRNVALILGETPFRAVAGLQAERALLYRDDEAAIL